MAHARTPLAQTSRRRLVLIAALLLLAYVALPQVGGFSDSWRLLLQANWALVLAAIGVLQLSFVAAAGMYQSLAARKLRFGRTWLVQLAGGFANRLLPAGLGGLTLNVQYLRGSKHILGQALAVAGMNNTLGSVVHGVLLLTLLLFVPATWPAHAQLQALPPAAYAGVAIAAVALLWALAFGRVRRYLYRLTSDVWAQFVAYRHRPRAVLLAMLCGLAVTASYTTTLLLAGLAVGVELTFTQAFVIFSAGMLVGTATPTPGGIVGAEAGLATAGVAYGLHAEAAIALALLYRLLTYWLPMAFGFVAFLRVRALYL